MGHRTLLPITWLSATGARGGAATTNHDGMVSSGRALMRCLLRGGWCDLDLRIPVSLNRQYTYMVRVANVKTPQLLAFAQRVEIIIIEAQKPRSTTLMGSRTLLTTTGTLDSEKNPPCNVEDNFCVPDSSSLKPGSGLLRESLIKGSSDSRTIYFGRTVRL